MPSTQPISLRIKALGQLGLRTVLPYLGYQFKLRSGLLRLQTPVQSNWRRRHAGQPQPLFELPDRGELAALLGERLKELYQEADEILAGQVCLFGGEARALALDPDASRHWSAYADHMPDGGDIKLVWEQGRFGWATVLARAYWLSGDEKYAEGFWAFLEDFLAANPPNQGPHWSSAQEVALRMIALGFCSTVLDGARASTVERKHLLASSLAAHAQRITPSLSYAQAQNNNHLLSEALGLYTAAALLPRHPLRKKWLRLGRRHFASGIRRQIDASGAYGQHSANYQRLMLQLALWAGVLARKLDEAWPTDVTHKIAMAARWLLGLLDTESGQAPNLGPNDGAHILPLTALPFDDYRPVLQAASRAFLGQDALGSGPWDEMAAWLAPTANPHAPAPAAAPQPLRIQGAHSWAYLRTARFQGRPGHADQLHLDLWWRGLNIARDPGSYRYNAPPPWDNALASTAVHNTVSINGCDQMQRASRFLWLDWAQARVLANRIDAASAEHDGYRKLGLTHQREVSVDGDEWLVVDRISGHEQTATARLHWLLPDWPYSLEGGLLSLRGPKGEIQLHIESPGARFGLVRAGEVLAGELPAKPILGWYSPSYDQKEAALSLIAELRADPPIEFRSRWRLP